MRLSTAFRHRRSIATEVLTLGLLLAHPLGAQAPDLPQRQVDVTMPAVTRTVRVPAGGDLQKAIDAARPGDAIVLESGAVYRGAFVLRPKRQSATPRWIVIRGATLPPDGARVSPAQAAAMPKLVLTTGDRGAVNAADGAGYYRLIGLEMLADPSVREMNALVRIHSPTPDSADTPHHIVLDRVYVHGNDGLQLTRCVLANGAHVAVIDSYLSECHAKGRDSQAFESWQSPGPLLVENSYLEGAGENLMLGGGRPSVKGVIPHDVTIRRNHLYKPLEWKGRWTVKNLLEVKSGIRVLVERNVLENSWVDGQIGTAFNLKSSSISRDSNDTETAHITVRSNRVRNVTAGMSITPRQDGPAIAAHDILVTQNWFSDVGTVNGTRNGRMLVLGAGIKNLAIVRNTFLHNVPNGTGLLFDGDNIPGSLEFTGNVLTSGSAGSGIKGSGTAAGVASLERYWPGARVTGNAFVGVAATAAYPGGNRLLPRATRAPSGVGADESLLDRATEGVVVR